MRELAEKEGKGLLQGHTEMMTTRELAETLGVDVSTVVKTVKRLNETSEVLPKFRQGQTPRFTEEQATLIKQEIQRHHNLASRQIDNVAADLEILANASKAFVDLQRLYQRKEAEYKAIIAEQKPKALVYDKISNASGLKSVEEVAKNLGWGKVNFFALLRGAGIFYYSNSSSGKINLPKQDFIKAGYFKTVEEPYRRGGKDMVYTKIYVTGKGETWLAQKIGEAAVDSAGEFKKEAEK